MSDKKNEPTPYHKYFVSHIDFDQLKGWRMKIKGAFRIWYSWEAKRKLEALLKEVKPDIAHLHNVAHQISPSILSVLRKHGIPAVMTLHDYQLICPNARLFSHGQIDESCLGGRYYRDVFNRSLKNSYIFSAVAAMEMYWHKALKIYEKNICRFIAPSNFMKNECVKFGIASAQITTLPYSFNLKDYTPHYESRLAEPYIIYFGRLAEEKGLAVLIKAMSAVVEPLNLIIVGAGPLEQELKDLTRDLKLTARVQFLGYRQGAELRRLIQEAQAVIVPSIWLENSPLAVYESFALGKPVIASNLGGLPELVNDGKRGLLVEPRNPALLAEKINSLAANATYRRQLGQAARRFVESDLHPDKHYDKVIKLYRDCLGVKK